MIAKRLFDLFFTIPGLIALCPVFVVISVLIKMDSKGPVFFRQTRVGRDGRLFEIFKFRTMIVDAESKGLQLTSGDDSRVTAVGRKLRKYKLDELPQLLNVLKGEMSLVGPRPEVPKYVAYYPEAVRKVVLSVPPGITDKASIEYIEESRLMSESRDPEKTYVEKILPDKLKYYQEYVENRSLLMDIKIILGTLKEII